MPQIKLIGAAIRHSPVIARKFLPLYQRNTRLGCVLTNAMKPQSVITKVVTKISSCRVFVVSSRGSRKQSWSPSPPLPQEVFEVQLLPFSKRHYRPKKAIFIKSTAIISGFMMITSLLKKTTSFGDPKIISFYFT